VRRGVHLLLVEPRVLGWAVASQHKSWVGAAKAPVLNGNDGSVRYGGPIGLPWTENHPTAGQQTRRWGSEASAASPAPGLAPATRPGRVLPVVSVRLASVSTAPVRGPRPDQMAAREPGGCLSRRWGN
jgi:hypothetical protein